ncbi:MAG: thermonuclease family protein [Planctomycetaceae bacterium]|nr:thermonuclease family protein [Planctomycetaceae bacterium]
MARRSKTKTKHFGIKILQNKRGITAVFVTLLALIGLVSPDIQDYVSGILSVAGTINPNQPLPSQTKSPLKEGIYTVVHVVDGDTFDVRGENGSKFRIRLIGADTPETVKPNTPVQPFGPEASAFTKEKIAAANNRVRIAFDGDQVDKYNRNLAMVYLQMPDGTEKWLNEWLIREGLARAQLQYRFSGSAKVRFRQAEQSAKNAKQNLWSVP